MPLPTPELHEDRDTFVQRCMDDPTTQEEFPDPEQRMAVCTRQWEERETPQVEMRASCTIEAQRAGSGALPRFRFVAYTGGAMRVNGWRHPIVIDLTGLEIGSQVRPIRFSHSDVLGVGHTERIFISEGKLLAEGVISRDNATAKEIVASARNGFPWQVSIGADVLETEYLKTGESAVVNSRTVAGPLTIVKKSVLCELSFVDLGADDHTEARLAAKRAILVREESNMSEEVEKSAEVVAESTGQPTTVSDAQMVDRIKAIRAICGEHCDIAARAIEEDWDYKRTALEVLRAERPKTAVVHSVKSGPPTTDVLEAACLQAAKMPNPERWFSAEVLEEAHRRFKGRLGLQELLLEAAWANGFTGRTFRDTRSILRYAFSPAIEAAHSTANIPGILSNVANKFLLDGFQAVEQTWRNICAVRSVSDFKAVTSYRLTGADQYELVPPGGELKHGTLGEEAFTNKADTYGLILIIDRRDIINDDLGALTTIPQKLGRGAGLKINDVFWRTLLGATGFFTAERGNYAEGANTALSIESLTAAEVLFTSMLDSDGKPVGLWPAVLLVPVQLSALAKQIYTAVEVRDNAASARYPVANPHQGKYQPEVSRYLSSPAYAGSSSTAWYLLANPAELAVIEVAFLDGQEAPTIETAEADFSTLGIQLRGYHDFGVALQDHRAAVKMKGSA